LARALWSHSRADGLMHGFYLAARYGHGCPNCVASRTRASTNRVVHLSRAVRSDHSARWLMRRASWTSAGADGVHQAWLAALNDGWTKRLAARSASASVNRACSRRAVRPETRAFELVRRASRTSASADGVNRACGCGAIRSEARAFELVCRAGRSDVRAYRCRACGTGR